MFAVHVAKSRTKGNHAATIRNEDETMTWNNSVVYTTHTHCLHEHIYVYVCIYFDVYVWVRVLYARWYIYMCVEATKGPNSMSICMWIQMEWRQRTINFE